MRSEGPVLDLLQHARHLELGPAPGAQQRGPPFGPAQEVGLVGWGARGSFRCSFTGPYRRCSADFPEPATDRLGGVHPCGTVRGCTPLGAGGQSTQGTAEL